MQVSFLKRSKLGFLGLLCASCMSAPHRPQVNVRILDLEKKVLRGYDEQLDLPVDRCVMPEKFRAGLNHVCYILFESDYMRLKKHIIELEP